MVDFCLTTSREEVRAQDGSAVHVITALPPMPHPRFSKFFAQIKQDLGFGIYVPDCDTTACSFSAATQAGSTDPTLNLDILEVSFRNLSRWKISETPQRLLTVQRIIGFQKRLAASGAFTNPRSHIYYLPELYCAYFGRCYAAFMALPMAARQAIDPGGAFALIRARVLAYVQDELIAGEMNVFDAALALIALGHLGAEPKSFAPALSCILSHVGEGGRRGPFRAYEWNKMKTPTRIVVGGPEVTSAFVLMALALARRAMLGVGVGPDLRRHP